MVDIDEVDSGVFVAEVRKQEAQAVNRVREAIGEQWKVASTVGAIVFAIGVAGIGDLETPVRVCAAIATVLWLIAVLAFLRARSGTKTKRFAPALAAAEKEVPPAPGEQTVLKQRDREAKINIKAAQAVMHDLQNVAFVWSALAVAATAVTLVVAAVSVDDSTIKGDLILTADGRAVIAEACPLIETPDQAVGLPVETDESLVGGDDEIWLRFDKGVCSDDARMRVVIDAELVLGIADP